MLSDVEGWGVASVLDVQSLFFYKRKLDLRHDPASCWTRYFYIIDKKSSFWLWRQTVKSSFNDTIALFVGQIEQQNAWSVWMSRDLVLFCFDFVCSHARCGCCSIVCLRFQFVQAKQVDCKMSTKNVNNSK